MAAPAPSSAPRPRSIQLKSISLREQERGLIVGGVDAGKSTLAEALCMDWVHRYAAKGGRLLILDSKPRFRAEWTVNGFAAASRYSKWSHGRTMPGSVVVDDPRDLEFAFKRWRIAIVQSMYGRELGRLMRAGAIYLDESRASRPQLVYVDETLDFFHGNGQPKGGDDTIVVLGRAGRERGTAALYGSQRTKGLSAILLSELKRGYVLRMDAVTDAKHLADFGMPIEWYDPRRPLEPHTFMYWTKDDYRRIYGPYKLALPKDRGRSR